MAFVSILLSRQRGGVVSCLAQKGSTQALSSAPVGPQPPDLGPSPWPPPPSPLPPWPPSLSPPGGVETVKPPRPSSSTGPPGRWRCRLSSVWNALRFPLGVSSSLFHLSSLSTSSGGCRKFLDPLRLTPLLRSRCRDLDTNSTFLFSIRFVTLVGNAPFSTLVSRCWELQVDLTRNPFTAGTVHNRVIRRGKKHPTPVVNSFASTTWVEGNDGATSTPTEGKSRPFDTPPPPKTRWQTRWLWPT